MAKKIYGIIDEYGKFVKAPKKVKARGRVYHNPKGDICKELGYYELITSEYPNDNKQYKEVYELKDKYIYQSWIEDDTITDETPEFIPSGEDDDIIEIDITTLEERVAQLERQMEFIMDFGKFKNHWLDEEEKYHNKKDLH